MGSSSTEFLDPLYSIHNQDEDDTRAMAALCQSLLRLRDASRAALVVVHHVRKSIGRHEIGSAFRGSSALHAVGDSYLLLTRPAPQLTTIELHLHYSLVDDQLHFTVIEEDGTKAAEQVIPFDKRDLQKTDENTRRHSGSYCPTNHSSSICAIILM